jgi:type VI secretion system protein ImpC
MATEQAKSALAEVQMQELGDLSSLLKKEFKPRTDTAEQAVESAVQTLAQQALANTALVKDDVVQSIEAMISALDAKIGKQLDKILHHPDFQQLEGAWRGLHYLVNNTETDETLKIRVLNVSKKDLGKTFSKFKGTAWDQSPLFKQLYEQEFGQLGGHPYGLLVGDYQFDQSPPDVEIMRGMAQVASAGVRPFAVQEPL